MNAYVFPDFQTSITSLGSSLLKHYGCAASNPSLPEADALLSDAPGKCRPSFAGRSGGSGPFPSSAGRFVSLPPSDHVSLLRFPSHDRSCSHGPGNSAFSLSERLSGMERLLASPGEKCGSLSQYHGRRDACRLCPHREYLSARGDNHRACPKKAHRLFLFRP